MSNREELLQSISPDMKLDKAFFYKVYGYEITYPGFKEIAIRELNKVGCSKALEHYNRIVLEYETKQMENVKGATAWYLDKCKNDFDKLVKEYERRTGDELSKQNVILDLHQKSDSELLSLLVSMN